MILRTPGDGRAQDSADPDRLRRVCHMRRIRSLNELAPMKDDNPKGVPTKDHCAISGQGSR